MGLRILLGNRTNTLGFEILQFCFYAAATIVMVVVISNRDDASYWYALLILIAPRCLDDVKKISPPVWVDYQFIIVPRTILSGTAVIIAIIGLSGEVLNPILRTISALIISGYLLFDVFSLTWTIVIRGRVQRDLQIR